MSHAMREWDFETPGGMRLRVCEWGEPEGRPIVILHGFLEQGAAWHLVASRLPGRVIAPDMRGHGLSGHVGGGGFYHFWDYVPDVVALLAHVGGPVDLVGHSMGGGVSMLTAALRPDLVRRLVNVEGLGPPDAEGEDAERAARFLEAMLSPPSHVAMRDLDAAVDRLRRHNPQLAPDFARFLAARTTRASDGGLVWTWDPRHRGRSPTPFRARMFRDFLERVKAPVLYVSGEKSFFRLPDEERRLGMISHLTRVVLPGGGHMMHLDCPEALAAAIAGHLAEEPWTPT